MLISIKVYTYVFDVSKLFNKKMQRNQNNQIVIHIIQCIFASLKLNLWRIFIDYETFLGMLIVFQYPRGQNTILKKLFEPYINIPPIPSSFSSNRRQRLFYCYTTFSCSCSPFIPLFLFLFLFFLKKKSKEGQNIEGRISSQVSRPSVAKALRQPLRMF